MTNGSDDAEERLSDQKIYYCGMNMLTSPDLDMITDELSITAGIMPQMQIARRKSGSASGSAGRMVPVLRVPSVAGFQVAAATTGQTMSDAGMLPAAGRAASGMRFAGPRGKGLELEPYGMDSSQADGVVVDQWYLSREKERKPYMVAARSYPLIAPSNIPSIT